jgi:hypothetical protein
MSVATEQAVLRNGTTGGVNRKTRLPDKWVPLGRIAWFAAVVPTIALFSAALPARFADLKRSFQNLSPAQELILRDLGISFELQPLIMFGAEVGVVVAFTGVAVVLFSRRSEDWLAILVSGTLVTYSTWPVPALDTFAAIYPIWQRPVIFIHVLGLVGGLASLYLFPDGRFAPRWTRLLLIPAIVNAVVWIAWPASPLALTDPYRLPLLPFLFLEAFLLTILVSPAWRLLRGSAPPEEQQQTKWVGSAVAFTVLGYGVFGVQRFVLPAISEPVIAGVVFDTIWVPFMLGVNVMIPTALAVAIMRYRLWDIDVIINRTLVYGTLTAILAGLYIAAIGFFQRLFIATTGANHEAAVVLTTLTVASAFVPVRNRLQGIADKRLREVPDPSRKMLQFREQVQYFVDLMDTRLLAARTVEESAKAFDAECAACYLDGKSQPILAHTCGDWNGDERLAVSLEHEGTHFGRLALGPRRNGQPYADRDQEALQEIALVVGRAMAVSESTLRKRTYPRDGASAGLVPTEGRQI